MQKIRLKVDSRSKRWSVSKTFGEFIQFPTEFSIKDSQPDFVQPIGDVECVAISCCDVASDKDNIQYDHQDLFNRIPHNEYGSSPQDGLGETVKGGLLPQGQSVRIKPFSSYYEAHSGSQDAFDSVRSALMKINYPVMVWTNYYANWSGVEILPLGQNTVSGHAYTIEGWKQINGEPMLIAEMWVGHKVYMSRSVFNDAVSKLGCGTAVLSTLSMDIDRKKTLIETILDYIQNLILLLKAKQQPMPTTPPESPITPVVESKSQKLYDLSYSLIGKHLTLDNSVPALYGCAQALSYVLKEFGCPIPDKGISSTNEMDKWLQKNCTQVDKPDVGDIIISVSYTGIAGARGHVGVVGHKAIMSNDSETGLWSTNWSLQGWLGHYKDELKLLTKYYRV